MCKTISSHTTQVLIFILQHHKEVLKHSTRSKVQPIQETNAKTKTIANIAPWQQHMSIINQQTNAHSFPTPEHKHNWTEPRHKFSKSMQYLAWRNEVVMSGISVKPFCFWSQRAYSQQQDRKLLKFQPWSVCLRPTLLMLSQLLLLTTSSNKQQYVTCQWYLSDLLFSYPFENFFFFFLKKRPYEPGIIFSNEKEIIFYRLEFVEYLHAGTVGGCMHL